MSKTRRVTKEVTLRSVVAGGPPGMTCKHLNLSAPTPRDGIWLAAVMRVLMAGGTITATPTGEAPTVAVFDAPADEGAAP